MSRARQLKGARRTSQQEVTAVAAERVSSTCASGQIQRPVFVEIAHGDDSEPPFDRAPIRRVLMLSAIARTSKPLAGIAVYSALFVCPQPHPFLETYPAIRPPTALRACLDEVPEVSYTEIRRPPSPNEASGTIGSWSEAEWLSSRPSAAPLRAPMPRGRILLWSGDGVVKVINLVEDAEASGR